MYPKIIWIESEPIILFLQLLKSKICLEIKAIKAAHINRNASVMVLNGKVGNAAVATATPEMKMFSF